MYEGARRRSRTVPRGTAQVGWALGTCSGGQFPPEEAVLPCPPPARCSQLSAVSHHALKEAPCSLSTFVSSAGRRVGCECSPNALQSGEPDGKALEAKGIASQCPEARKYSPVHRGQLWPVTDPTHHCAWAAHQWLLDCCIHSQAGWGQGSKNLTVPE